MSNMSDRQYEDARDRILGRKPDEPVLDSKPIEDLRAKHCAIHADIIASQQRTIETQDKTIERLRAQVEALQACVTRGERRA